MIEITLQIAFCILSVAILLGMVRLGRGPTVLDRIMGFDLLTTSSVGIIILLSILWKAPVFLELILIFSLLGFFGTVAFVFYLSRLHRIDTSRKPAHLADEEDAAAENGEPDPPSQP
ncbi:MAG TPA: monovalent cation/H+ antiporter complex subunit F [Chthoniobacteraceae bacterium]|nr:monovalent cation/H+ antiporter complex subunit F [Chthoniobacteraceae bacterium]